MTETAQETTKLYDADAEQRFVLTIEDDAAEYEIEQIYSGLPDDVLGEYDRLRELTIDSNGKNTDLQTNSVEADEYLFGELCVDVRGYEGDKPENWRDLVDYEEKKYGIGKLLAVKIIESNKEKTVQKRSWGKPSTENTVVLKSYFDGGIVETSATFSRKTPGDIAAYAVVKNRISLIDRDLEDSAIKIPASMKKKAKLFDKINPQTSGYAGRVPMHHKAAFVTGFFETRISSAEKK